ncbi:DMT family transporter [Marinifilum fragile]|uniref:DMT family transporter n=1 Tax=Marinifilum fragile TaxID=570161 RepID=UPI002AA6C428|nr:DMT family transporter [Marinifilum fragile]
MKAKTKGLLAAHVSVVLFGATGLFGKFIILPSPIIVIGRVFFASFLLCAILIVMKRSIKLRLWRDYKRMIVLGVLWAINLVSFFQSVQVSTVAIGVLSFATFPIFTTFLEPLFNKEKITYANVLIAITTMIGIVLVIPEFDFGNSVVKGLLWGLMSGFSLALLSIFSRRYVPRYSSLVVTFYQNMVATIVLIPFLFLLKFELTTGNISLLLLLGTIFSAIPHLLLINSLNSTKAQLVSIILSLESVYGIIFAIVFLNELPTARVILGGIIIIGMSTYATLRFRKQKGADLEAVTQL